MDNADAGAGAFNVGAETDTVNDWGAVDTWAGTDFMDIFSNFPPPLD